MKKIPTIFKRDLDRNAQQVTAEVNPKCKWVFHGEGIATQKHDGTCAMVSDGRLYKRRTVRKGQRGPSAFVECDFDPNTGKYFGWVPVDPESKDDRYYMEAWSNAGPTVVDGTYELVGPKIQGNPEGYSEHTLLKHGSNVLDLPDRTFKGIADFMRDRDIEGIVFHHPDGRMGKIKKRDFSQKRRENNHESDCTTAT